jgi:hypothetical protein
MARKPEKKRDEKKRDEKSVKDNGKVKMAAMAPKFGKGKK